MLNGLDLFSGIGGLSIALSEWVKPTAYCEIDRHCQGVLLSRMASRDIGIAPIWDDICTFPMESFRGKVDIIFGGFPCQDISVAGAGKGLEGERSGLFYEMLRATREIKPRWLFLENVPAITTRGGRDVVREVTTLGYDCRWCIISAASIGALHRRERWFLLAHAQHDGASACEARGSLRASLAPWKQYESEKSKWQAERASCIPRDVSDTNCERCQEQSGTGSIPKRLTRSEYNSDDGDTNNEPSQQTCKKTKSKPSERRTWGRSTGQCWPFTCRDDWQAIVSSMGKCTDGLPNLVDRLRGLGNAVVPQQAKKAFEILMGLK